MITRATPTAAADADAYAMNNTTLAPISRYGALPRHISSLRVDIAGLFRFATAAGMIYAGRDDIDARPAARIA